ncbi:MAG: tyrosine-type recombinase/integrase [Bacteroidota bacterium]
MPRKTISGTSTTIAASCSRPSRGSPLEPSYISGHYFGKLIEKAKLRKMNLHALRHTRATILARQRVPLKVVSERLRHSSVAITGDICSHVFAEMDHQAADSFHAATRAANERKKALARPSFPNPCRYQRSPRGRPPRRQRRPAVAGPLYDFHTRLRF